MKYMLDTNTVSFLLKGNFPLLDRKILTIPPHELCISVITKAELLYGLAKIPQATRLQALVSSFLSRIIVLPWEDSCAEYYALVRSDLERKGLPIGSQDLLIAAHALASRCILISNNTREFQRVTGLLLEDWTKEPMIHSTAK